MVVAPVWAGLSVTARPDTGVDGVPEPRGWRERIRGDLLFQAWQVHGSGIEGIVEAAPSAPAVGRQTQVRGCFQRRCGEHSIERFEQRITPTPKGRVVDLLTEGSERFPIWCVHVQKDGLTSLLLSTRR